MSQENEENTGGTSKSLIERVRDNDQEAWDDLCSIYGPLVYDWGRKSGLGRHDSEDIVQDVFRRVASGLDSFKHGGDNHTFRGWLWTISRNVICDRHKKIASEVAKPEGGTQGMQRVHEAPDWITLQDADEPELEVKEEAALLRRALKLVENDFAQHTWNAFWQFTIEGGSAKEVAREFGISESGVRQAKFRILARLREALGEL